VALFSLARISPRSVSIPTIRINVITPIRATESREYPAKHGRAENYSGHDLPDDSGLFEALHQAAEQAGCAEEQRHGEHEFEQVLVGYSCKRLH
jgi:hypothetical protein